MHNATTGTWSQVIRTNAKREVAHVAWRVGLLQHCSKVKSRNRALILAYHRINTKEYIRNNNLMPGMYLSDKALELHIKWLLDNYRILTVSDIITQIRNRKEWNEPVCAITFDDGWYDNYEYAFPIFKHYQVPATIFVIGNRIGTCEPDCWDMCFEIIQQRRQLPRNLTGLNEIDDALSSEMDDLFEKARQVINKCRKLEARQFEQVWTRLRRHYYDELDSVAINAKYRMLNWENMREMQECGIEFGYHSKTHYMLTNVPGPELDNELAIPREEAERRGVHLKDIFCYPDGKFNDHIITTLKKMGYQGAVSLINGLNGVDSDPYTLCRICIHEGSAGTLPELLLQIAIS